MKKLFYWLLPGLFCAVFSAAAPAQSFILRSPDQKLVVTINTGNQLTYRMAYNGQEVLGNSPIAITLAGGRTLGGAAKPRNSKTATVNRTVKPPYGITAEIKDNFNELTLNFSGNFSVVFRAYNEGMAYRFVTSLPGTITVQSEEATFNWAGDYPAYFHPLPGNYLSSFEEHYQRRTISQYDSAGRLATLPFLVEVPNGPRVVLLESDLLDYPGLNLKAQAGSTTLKGAFAAYPKKTHVGGHANFNVLVDEREDFIARTAGTRSFPWRIVAVAPTDADLLANQLVYLLASDSKIGDAAWVKPGKVAWDWWNALNLTGVPFKTGFNTETYKYFIDFASRNGIEYVNLDEGWSDQFDLLKVTDKLDMPEVIRYAKEKNVGLILWCVWHTLDRQMIPALDLFQKWGIAGLKVDFMDRDDQVVVNFYERLLQEAAKRQMLVNYHGAYKPTGLQRTYPNNINREGVRGLEWDKFHPQGATPEHAVSIPFIRMVAGPMDYTPGAMTNANRKDWRQVNDHPMSQGTRCHQLAMYVVYYAPLQMLSDAPTAYEREQDVLDFLNAVPTTWDQTVPLESKVADYVTVARRKEYDWFVGSMTDWTSRTLKIKLDFLDEGPYYVDIFSDGPNADRIGSDYVKTTRQVTSKDELTIDMAPGGGWAARFRRVTR